MRTSRPEQQYAPTLFPPNKRIMLMTISFAVQGGIISGFYRFGQGAGRLPDGTIFDINLDNARNVGGYCNAYPNLPAATTCANPGAGDGNSINTQT